ncbi:MAG: hypothetical protein LBL59_04215, partial [Xanthomonadaceae bacterium]|nr:hypothetical protein [Xanthomonadaceae bacterium]
MSSEAERQRIRESLLQNEQFIDMPSGLREVILHSPTASRQFETFFSKGGIIRDDESEELAYYSGTESPEIVVSQFKYQEARLPHRDDMRRSLFSIMAHEIGHDAINYEAHPFRGSTEEEYVAYRAEHEAMAIQNVFPIFKELSETMPDFKPDWNSVGYLQGIELAGLYKEWETTRDNRAAIDAIAAKVAATPYSRAGMQDMDGDGHLTTRDQYLRDFREDQARKQRWNEGRRQEGEQVKNPSTSEPQASQRLIPAQPGHSDYDQHQRLLNKVQALNGERGSPWDEAACLRVTASLLVAVKGDPMIKRIDDIQLNQETAKAPAEKWIAVFYRPYGDQEPSFRVYVDTQEALNTPVEKAYERLQAQ